MHFLYCAKAHDDGKFWFLEDCSTAWARAGIQHGLPAPVPAELEHGNAAQGQRWRIVALESTERIAGGAGTCGSCDQGIHGERLHHRVWVRRACEISWTQACTTCSPASICLDFPPTHAQGDGADHGRGYTFVSHGHKRVLFVDCHDCHECNVLIGRAILVVVADQ